MLESLRDVAVASMILSRFTIGASSAGSGHYRDAAIGMPCAVIAQRVNRTHPHVPPTALCQIYRAYDYFLGQISREEVRTELDGLEHATRDGNPTFRALRENAQTLANAIEQVVEGLWQNSQMRENMVRFCLL